MFKQTDATLKQWLSRAIATGGPYDPAALFIGVYSAIADDGLDTVQADVTEATGALATRQAIAAWSAPYKMLDGRWACDAAPKTFRPADETESQTITGYFLNSAAAAGTLKAWENFASPRNLPNNDHAQTILVRLTIDPLGRFGVTSIING